MKAIAFVSLLLSYNIANSQALIKKLLIERNSSLCYSITKGNVDNDLAPKPFFATLNNYFIDSLTEMDIDVYKASANLDSICSKDYLFEIYNESASQRITICNANSFGAVKDEELNFINYRIKPYFVNLYETKSNIVFLTCTLDDNNQYIAIARNNKVDFNKIQRIGEYMIYNAASY